MNQLHESNNINVFGDEKIFDQNRTYAYHIYNHYPYVVLFPPLLKVIQPPFAGDLAAEKQWPEKGQQVSERGS